MAEITTRTRDEITDEEFAELWAELVERREQAAEVAELRAAVAELKAAVDTRVAVLKRENAELVGVLGALATLATQAAEVSPERLQQAIA